MGPTAIAVVVIVIFCVTVALVIGVYMIRRSRPDSMELRTHSGSYFANQLSTSRNASPTSTARSPISASSHRSLFNPLSTTPRPYVSARYDSELGLSLSLKHLPSGDVLYPSSSNPHQTYSNRIIPPSNFADEYLDGPLLSEDQPPPPCTRLSLDGSLPSSSSS
eukprot:m.138053 g.138053  ORF g.138053 m.138053 type:complete len:164 (+) comp24019_c0_seq2:2271-2762(+)